MFKLMIGCLGGLLVVLLLGQVVSMDFFFAACLVLILTVASS
jgi:hypothetical protein